MEIKNHFGVYGICYENGKLLCIEKTRGPYQYRFDLPGGSQELGEGLTETLKREVLEETGYTPVSYTHLGFCLDAATGDCSLNIFARSTHFLCVQSIYDVALVQAELWGNQVALGSYHQCD